MKKKCSRATGGYIPEKKGEWGKSGSNIVQFQTGKFLPV